MKKTEVPQDEGFSEGIEEIAYAVDEKGRYTLVKSRGWDVKTIANDQAWEVVQEEIQEVLRSIKNGKRSPLAFHMKKNLMDASLLAGYAGVCSLKVRWHLTPWGFRRLSPRWLARYAEIFNISVEQLTNPLKYIDEYK